MPRNYRDVNPEQKRQAILAAAARLFLTEGYEATGMSQIATEAGVAPNTLYWYFEDKDALLVATLDRLLDVAGTEYRKVRSKPLHLQLMWMLEQVERVPGLVATVHARVSVSKCVRDWHEQFHATLEAMVADELGRRGMPKKEQTLAARTAMFVLEGLVSHPTSDRAEREATLRFVTKTLSRGHTVAGQARRPQSGRTRPPLGIVRDRTRRPEIR
jgi:AcrR family transcriptional regulator